MGVDRLPDQPNRAVILAVFFALIAGLTHRLTPAQPSDPGPPIRLEVEPNAIVDPIRPMTIEVGGVPSGQQARLQILQDCNDDGRPELQSQAECISPLEERDSVKAGNDNAVHDRLSFQDLDQALKKAGKPPLPRKKTLWLRASRQGSKQGRLVIFGLVEAKDVCALWQTAVDTLFGGRCNPGLVQALRHHRGANDPQKELLGEVRHMNTQAAIPQAVAIPGTLGATGVAWVDAEELLVTIGGAAARQGPTEAASSSATSGPPKPVAEGLWRIPLVGGEPLLLWAKPRGETREAVAPLQLPGGRIAFVRQSPGEETVEGEEPAALLSLWQEGKLDPEGEIPIPYKIHQLLASDLQGRTILALTLGTAANRPAFLQIDLIHRYVENLGYHPALYQAALRAPGAEESVVAYVDNSGQKGWELALFDSQGNRSKELQTRVEDDLQPAWQPGGKEIAYLAEVERRKERRP